MKKIIPRYTRNPMLAYLFGMGIKCPLCNTYLKTMRPYGLNQRENAQCRICDSIERHRWLYIWLKEKTGIFKKPSMVLEVTPNDSLRNLFLQYPNIEYYTIDIFLNPKYSLQADLTQLPYKESTFDYIILMQVMEHITNDEKAFMEILRTLKNGGKCIINVPLDIDRTETIMDPHLSPEERLEQYGQADHVRVYGEDILKKLESYNFSNVNRISPNSLLSDHAMKRFSIKNEYPIGGYRTCDDLFVCIK